MPRKEDGPFVIAAAAVTALSVQQPFTCYTGFTTAILIRMVH